MLRLSAAAIIAECRASAWAVVVRLGGVGIRNLLRIWLNSTVDRGFHRTRRIAGAASNLLEQLRDTEIGKWSLVDSEVGISKSTTCSRKGKVQKARSITDLESPERTKVNSPRRSLLERPLRTTIPSLPKYDRRARPLVLVERSREERRGLNKLLLISSAERSFPSSPILQLRSPTTSTFSSPCRCADKSSRAAGTATLGPRYTQARRNTTRSVITLEIINLREE